MKSTKKKEHIVVSEETKKMLDKIGNKGDTYEDIILRLIKNIGGKKNERRYMSKSNQNIRE